MPSLFDPLRVGAWELPNRIVMAPLTRNRADRATLAVKPMHAEYYRQRAGAGMIVTEATQIRPDGQGYIDTPGIYSPEQVAAWRTVTEAVHAAGGRIVLQLWHVGRISHVKLLGGNKPIAPSAIRAKAKTFTPDGFEDVSEPRALELDEIPQLVADYAAAAENAKAAGFDGVEIHAANGYLLDQFLRDGSNKRTDDYGGPIENRARLVLEVADAVSAVWGPERVGIRFSPFSGFSDMTDSDPVGTFGYVIDKLNGRGLAYLHLVEGETGGGLADPAQLAELRRRWTGIYMANNGYDRARAIAAVENAAADLIAFGRPFIANPDLPERLRLDARLNDADQSTFYGGDERGYTDYPTLGEVRAAA
jgi:N-ethylmaleimide reductase